MSRAAKIIRIRNARGQLLYLLRKCHHQAQGCRRYRCRGCGELIPARGGHLWLPNLCLDCRVLLDRAFEVEMHYLEILELLPCENMATAHPATAGN